VNETCHVIEASSLCGQGLRSIIRLALLFFLVASHMLNDNSYLLVLPLRRF